MPESQRGSSFLMLVAATKLAEAALMLLAALCAHRLLHGDAQQTMLRWIAAVRVDPENRFAHAMLGKATGLSPRKLEAISLGTMLYGSLFAVEGAGLIFQKRWAEWLTVVSTAGFLPIEIYEIVEHVRPVRIVVLLINLLIVVYLVVRLMGRKR